MKKLVLLGMLFLFIFTISSITIYANINTKTFTATTENWMNGKEYNLSISKQSSFTNEYYCYKRFYNAYYIKTDLNCQFEIYYEPEEHNCSITIQFQQKGLPVQYDEDLLNYISGVTATYTSGYPWHFILDDHTTGNHYYGYFSGISDINYYHSTNVTSNSISGNFYLREDSDKWGEEINGNLYAYFDMESCQIKSLNSLSMEGIVTYSRGGKSNPMNIIEKVIEDIYKQLGRIESWLFFWDQGNTNLCETIENECGEPELCVDECVPYTKECIDAKTKWQCEKQVDGCFDIIEYDCDPNSQCVDGLCEVEEIICNYDWDCGDVGWLEEPYCGSGVMKNYVYDAYLMYDCINPGTVQSYCRTNRTDMIRHICPDGQEICSDGVCVGVANEEVIFRTNVPNGEYYDCGLRDNCWIALDVNNDGELDPLGFDGKGSDCHEGDVLGYTPEGYSVIDYGSSDKYSVCDNKGKEIRFSKSSRRAPKDPELSLVPVEPYASNGQEVYEYSE